MRFRFASRIEVAQALINFHRETFGPNPGPRIWYIPPEPASAAAKRFLCGRVVRSILELTDPEIAYRYFAHVIASAQCPLPPTVAEAQATVASACAVISHVALPRKIKRESSRWMPDVVRVISDVERRTP
jgi:hypothetical protein